MDNIPEAFSRFSFTAIALLVGAFFILLSGGLTIPGISFSVQSNIQKYLLLFGGLILIVFALFIETLRFLREQTNTSNGRIKTNPKSEKAHILLPSDKRIIIEVLLETSARAIIHPQTHTQVFIRAFCHRADNQKKELIPVCFWCPHYTEDYDAHIPFEMPSSKPFVISAAYKEKKIIARNVPPNHLNLYPPELKNRILPELKCILAAPICNFDSEGGDVLGTVCFDSSSHTLQEIGFDSETAKDILRLLAKSIYLVMKLTGESE